MRAVVTKAAGIRANMLRLPQLLFMMIKAKVRRTEVDQRPNLPRKWRRLPSSRGSSRP